MRKLNISSISLFLGILATLFSCFEESGRDSMIQGSFVEIGEATTASGLTVSKSYTRTNNGVGVRDSLRINLVGRQRSTPIVVNFEVDASGTTAVANVHYTMISTGTATIPANSSFGYIYFEVLDDNINEGEVWNLKINLTGTDASDVKLSENFKSFTRAIRTLCPFNRANFVGTYSVIEPGYSGSPYLTSSVADIDNNSIIIDNFWDFGGIVKYTFNPSTNAVTLPTQDVVMGGTTYVVAQGPGSATYNVCTYSFVVPYTVRRKSDNALFDSNTHTFTKQ